jgi:hypothetical protein
MGRTILITNNALVRPGGTEWVVHDLARELRRRGQIPMVFSSHLGAFAESIRTLGIAVVDDLGQLDAVPDLIHGQHHMETMMALAYFDRTPAIYHCHGYLPWQEVPPIHPRILAYAAISNLTARFVADRTGWPFEQVRIMHNHVDTDRMSPPRSELPEHPGRAVIFQHSITSAQSQSIAAACLAEGISCTTYSELQPPVTHPELILGQFDLAFAAGKSALDAMAIGLGVIICTGEGLGELVSPENFDAWRDRNFASGSSGIPVESERVREQLRLYSPAGARQVHERIRTEATLACYGDRVVALHEFALKKASQGMPEISPQREREAFHHYLLGIKEFLRLRDDHIAWHYWDRENREAEMAVLRAKVAALSPSSDARFPPSAG